MKWPEILVILIALFVFFFPYPSPQIQMEQERSVSSNDHKYYVVYQSKKKADAKVADILWLKAAAKVAQEAGIPYFNILSQKRTSQDGFDRIEGVILLDNDPMNTNYDANEIESLPLFLMNSNPHN
ncbi:MAG: hypothetical protein AB7I27_13605 [Bacteriovoracaceae bacterium]